MCARMCVRAYVCSCVCVCVYFVNVFRNGLGSRTAPNAEDDGDEETIRSLNVHRPYFSL